VARIIWERKIYDPDHHFIICVNSIGSPYGSSKPENFDFPYFTVRDVVKAHLLIAEDLKITKIQTAIGGSFGGYQALEFAYSYMGKLDHLILLASSAKESAWGIAIHESQRMALKADVTFGEKEEGKLGMRAARAIAMLTYRTSQDLINNQKDEENVIDDFKASSYINYQGDKFSKTFDAMSLYYLTKCIDSHNIGRRRGGEIKALGEIKIPTLVIGFNSDTLVPIRFQKFLAQHLPNAVFKDFDSKYGHDGFLKELEKIKESINYFYVQDKQPEVSDRVVLKFGGSSLYGKGKLKKMLDIVKAAQRKNAIALIVSARGKSTDMLIGLFGLAKKAEDFSKEFEAFKEYLWLDDMGVDITPELDKLFSVLKAISLLKDDSEFAYDMVIAFGEIISAKSLTKWLAQHGLKTHYLDARKLIFTEKLYNEYEVDIEKSRSATHKAFAQIEYGYIPVIAGFIATSEENKTVTLGRNGSNYTASLIAYFIQASKVQNWTDVDGVFSADPRLVPTARRISNMTYKEANEMAHFGMSLLHHKTILPLTYGKIPLYIKNTNIPDEPGTCIDNNGGAKGIKAVTSLDDVALVTIEGDELSHSIGIDSRIFSSLEKEQISIKMISQASSERGIGFVIAQEDAAKAEVALNREFKIELRLNNISSIRINKDIGIISIIGRHNFALEKVISILRKNTIWMYLISNSINGEHISLVVDRHLLKKAVRITHNQVFGITKVMHVFAYGKGNVGATFIDEILHTPKEVIENRRLQIKIIGVCDSKRYFINPEGLDTDWKNRLAEAKVYNSKNDIIKEINQLFLNNVVIADNTSSEEVSLLYTTFIKSGFDLVASNKKFNSSEYREYIGLRKLLKQKDRHFYYEANVGAGLPIINFLKSLYSSSDKVTKIRGVFSGSLSYIFNTFSEEQISFSDCVKQAKAKGFTEPDPREDLGGLDVARKLVILAREINYPADLMDVQLENLIPESLMGHSSYEDFMGQTPELNTYYQDIKSNLSEGHVLRYVAELNVPQGKMEVILERVPKATPLGQIKNADSLFEIYTESYGDQPVVIQGAGAGPKVTARAVYSDLLKIGHSY
jgi:homoserine O-acetyltransferase